MASINIDRRIDDPFGRYQMPRLSIQNQGGKTILVNIFDVGKALHRSPLCM
jgi:translation initiation factor 2 beta subunit (eIF-2beta)/eIF-5